RVAVVEHHADTVLPQIGLNGARARQNGFLPVASSDWYDHDLIWRDAWRQDQPAVVAVGHDHATDEPCRYAPRRRPGMLQRLVPALELNLECLGKVLTEIVRGPGLERTPVPHQRFNRIG